MKIFLTLLVVFLTGCNVSGAFGEKNTSTLTEPTENNQPDYVDNSGNLEVEPDTDTEETDPIPPAIYLTHLVISPDETVEDSEHPQEYVSNTTLNAQSEMEQEPHEQSHNHEVLLGDSVHLKAIGFYSDGSKKDLTDKVTWKLNEQTYLGVKDNEFLGRVVGTTVIHAQYQDVQSDHFDLSVEPRTKAVTWGNTTGGAHIEPHQKSQLIDVVKIVPGFDTFSALKSNGDVIFWGSGVTNEIKINGKRTFEKIKNIKDIYETSLEGRYLPYHINKIYLGKTTDGEYISWEKLTMVTALGVEMEDVKQELDDVKQVYSTKTAMAALNHDGTVVTWGGYIAGGDSSAVKEELKDVVSITGNEAAFAALKADGTVVTWGSPRSGGNSDLVDWDGYHLHSIKDQLTNVKSVVSNEYSFAALKKDGTVVTWGERYYQPSDNTPYLLHGADSSSVQSELKNVVALYPAGYAYAALKDDGTVVTWGEPALGGNSDNIIESPHREGVLENVAYIHGGYFSFTAVKHDDSATAWGQMNYGGMIDINNDHAPDYLTNIKKIISNHDAYAALKHDGTVVAWGNSNDGGKLDIDKDGQVDKLTDVKEIYASSNAFTALKNDGTLVTWGAYVDNSKVKDLKNVLNVYSNLDGFVALVKATRIEELAGLSHQPH